MLSIAEQPGHGVLLDEAYEMAPPHVRCDSKFWDVYDVQADDVIFDQRSLMKLAAAFYPKILVPYEAEQEIGRRLSAL